MKFIKKINKMEILKKHCQILFREITFWTWICFSQWKDNWEGNKT